MHNCNYNKIVLLARFRGMLWRLEQYKKDAKAANHPLCNKVLDEIEADLKKHSKKLEDAIAGLARENKFTFCEKC